MRRASLFRPPPTRRTSGGPARSALADTSPLTRTTLTGLALSRAFALMTASRRSPVVILATSGAIDWAWAVAESTARSAAWERSNSASGTRTETSTSEQAASTSRLMRSLMAGSRRSAALDSDPAHGVDVARLLRRLPEFAAQPRDVDVHRLVGPAVGHPPHVGEQIPPANHLPGVQREVVDR